MSGTWMQMAAQAWLVLTLTGSAATSGLIVAAQTLPILLLGPYGGVIADRVNKLRAMVFLQAMMGLQALALHPSAPQGSTPIGGPIVGWTMAKAGARAGLGVGAITCLLVALAGLLAIRGLMPFAGGDAAPRPARP